MYVTSGFGLSSESTSFHHVIITNELTTLSVNLFYLDLDILNLKHIISLIILKIIYM